MRAKREQTGFPTIRERRREIEAKALSIEDVRREVAGLIEAKQDLNAFISVMLKDASQGNEALPLAGVPIGLKDFFDTAGVRTTAGSPQFADRVPTEDAEVVRALKSLGALLVGKTNMHTLGMGTTSLESHFGPVRNPRLRDRVAGGSSGGSAAAVASGICFATIDTDAVGSARLPAACCAVTGFKPSHGRLSADGILKGEPADATIIALNHTSMIARSAEDAALLFSLLTSTSVTAETTPPRLGLVANHATTDPMKRKFEGSLPAVVKLAASTTEVTVPFSEARFDATGVAAARAAINQRMFTAVDLLVLPTLAGPVPTIEDARRAGAQAVSPANTFFANYFGLPAISIPIEKDEELGPIALQIVGPVGGDARVLGFARQVQERFPPPPPGS